MAIIIQAEQFHLQTEHTSYIFSVYKEKYLAHLYWGDRLKAGADLRYFPDSSTFFRPSSLYYPLDGEFTHFLIDVPLEFSTAGRGDFRTPSLQVRAPDGSNVCDYVYAGYRVLAGKPALPGLPAVYCEETDTDAETLEIELCDPLTQLHIFLQYSVLPAYDVICRSVRYENHGAEALHLLDVSSACVDFYGQDYQILNLHGDWLRERSAEWVPVCHGVQSFDSKRGMSGHMHTPCLMLCEKGVSPEHGQAYGMMLVYSGSFRCFAEGTDTGTTRAGIGINPFGFDWLLQPGEAFQTPEAICVHSGGGLTQLSQRFHRVLRERLCRGVWRDRERPVLINNWEGTYFDFDEEKLLQIAQSGAALGAELFVLDDGWFGKRKDDRSSLGDWYPNPDKLPNGLAPLSARVHALGMKFGLWVEPEMVSPDSDLYRLHPDWCLHVPGRERTQHRQQLVLDLSRQEICGYLLETLSRLFTEAQVDYVKWDCNRNINETISPMQAHQYMLGLYALLEKLTARFPDILFESCAGGGGRFDAGMLHYMPQTWTSDETDALRRVPIQYGTALLYPAVTMGAHMGNFPCGRPESDPLLDMAAKVAMSGSFGVELDPTRFSENEHRAVQAYIAQYKALRPVVQFGTQYLLESPFEGDYASVLYTGGQMAVLFAYQTRRKANAEERRIRLRGLDPEKRYCCSGYTYDGEILMQLGFRIAPDSRPYHADIFVFTEEGVNTDADSASCNSKSGT